MKMAVDYVKIRSKVATYTSISTHDTTPET